jgi:DNA replication and repair protein RecF
VGRVVNSLVSELTPTQSFVAGAGPETAARGRASALWLSRLTLSDFRCYGGAKVEADARPLVLTGPNGAGKTNLLEAISFLAPGRGLRRARLGEIDRVPLGSGGAAARVMTPDGRRELGTGRDPAPGNGADGTGRERRVVKIDGAFARGQQALGEVVSMVWLTPQMDGLFREAASGRRRFLDRLVYGFDPSHAGRVSAYEQVLRQRARLLKEGGGDVAWLSSLEDSMARHGVAIAAARRALLVRLAGACAAGVGPFPGAGLGLAGEVETWLDACSALEAEERLRAELSRSRTRDGQSGGAAIGPHRSDLIVKDLENGLAAELCSTGEQKALLISIVLAHARLLTLDRGAAPFLLLDEIAAHLDEDRRRALFAELLALGAQAWLTGTDAEVFAALREQAQFFEVRAATVRRAA